MEVKPLSEDIISKIRSSFNIKTVNHCVKELVLNSLDAKSTAVAIRVNLFSLRIQVVDNGHGISKSNMDNVGQRYMTNKIYDLKDFQKKVKFYGFRGESLASIAQISKSISIESRNINANETYSKTITTDKESNVLLNKNRYSPGTTVTVESFFSKLPVRHKQIKEDIELEEIKDFLERLTIIHPEVSFSFRNDLSGKLISNYKKHESVIKSFVSLYPQIKENELIIMKVNKNNTTVEALLCKDHLTDKKLQFIYVNRRPVVSSKLYKFVNYTFTKNQKTNDVKHATSKFSSYEPVYILNIKCPYSEVDLFFEMYKTKVHFKNWDIILNCIVKLLLRFLGKSDSPEENPRAKRVIGDFKSDCGISELVGAVKGYGYKRKECIVSIHSDQQSVKPDMLKTESFESTPKKIKLLDNPKHQTVATNKTKLKPLPIKICQKESTNKKHTKRRKHILKSNPDLLIPQIEKKKSIEELESSQFLPKISNISLDHKSNICQDNHLINEKTVAPRKLDNSITKKYLNDTLFTRFTGNENKGKDLIMYMFLKSTECFKDEENRVDSFNNSGETVLESNLIFENTVKTGIYQVDKTMSVCLKVKAAKKNSKRPSMKTKRNVLSNITLTTIKRKVVGPFRGVKDDVLRGQTRYFKEGDKQEAIKKRGKNKKYYDGDRDKKLPVLYNCQNLGEINYKYSDNIVNNYTILPNFHRNDMDFKNFADYTFKIKQIHENTFFKQPFILEKDRFAVTNFRKSMQNYVPEYDLDFSNLNKYSEFNMGLIEERASVFNMFDGTRVYDGNNQYLFNFQQTKFQNDGQGKNDNSNDLMGNPVFHRKFTNCVNGKIGNGSFVFEDISLSPIPKAPVHLPNFQKNCYKETCENINLRKNYHNEKSSFLPLVKFHTDSSLNYKTTTTKMGNVQKTKENIDKLFSMPNLRKYKTFEEMNKRISNKTQTIIKNEFSLDSLENKTAMEKNHQKSEIKLWEKFLSSKKMASRKTVIPSSSNIGEDRGQSIETITFHRSANDPVKTQTLNVGDEKLLTKSIVSQTRKESSSENKNVEIGNSYVGTKTVSQLLFTSSDVQSNLVITLNDQEKQELIEGELQADVDLCKRNNEYFTPSNERMPPLQDEWIERNDDDGNTFYINSRTGMATFNCPPTEENQFCFTKRLGFVPKGLSPLLVKTKALEVCLNPSTKKKLQKAIIDTYENELLTIKWRLFPQNIDTKLFFDKIYNDKLKTFENEIPNISKNNLPMFMMKSGGLNFNRQLFNNIDIIGQLDSKFITVLDRSNSTLILFDQHAVHERVCLEQLMKGYSKESSKCTATTLFLSDSDIIHVLQQKKYLNEIGLYFETFKNGITIHKIPLSLLNKTKKEESLKVYKLAEHLETLIRDIVQHSKQTRGILTGLPKSIQDIINMEACRGAVKFGDKLSKDECKKHLRDLSNCQLPFQCAHGRPTLIPLINLSHQLRHKVRKPTLLNIKEKIN